jgi:ribonuclease BN (tRNA processing enzyme)
MKIQFIGVGSAFTLPPPEEDGSVDLNKCDWQSNAIITSKNGNQMLLDCGSDIRFSLAQIGIVPSMYGNAIGAIYISHLHADHIGGMEALGFCTFFNPKAPKPTLFCNANLMPRLWEQSLRGGLESIQGQMMNLTSYFECRAVPENGTFRWEGINFVPVQTVHIMSGYEIKHSYGLLIHECNDTGDTTIMPKRKSSGSPIVFFSTDTQFCPNQIRDFYDRADIIFHDCETGFKSGVHAHYDDLKTLDTDTKNKMWLYHYQQNPKQNAVEDGFAGFVQKGQIFDISWDGIKPKP